MESMSPLDMVYLQFRCNFLIFPSIGSSFYFSIQLITVHKSSLELSQQVVASSTLINSKTGDNFAIDPVSLFILIWNLSKSKSTIHNICTHNQTILNSNSTSSCLTTPPTTVSVSLSSYPNPTFSTMTSDNFVHRMFYHHNLHLDLE